MRAAALLGVVTLSLGAGTGCGGGGSSASLDCAWLAGENCWKTTASQAVSCLPPEADTGVLSADLRSCAYANGTVVTFDPPLVLPLPEEWSFKFSIASAGTTCLRYDETDSGLTLTVNGQTYRESYSGFRLSATCPDGTSYSNSNALELLSCESEAGIFSGLPGHFWSDSDSFVSFGFLNTSNDTTSSLPVFDCSRAVSASSASTAAARREARIHTWMSGVRRR
jgi:hypothetical protein